MKNRTSNSTQHSVNVIEPYNIIIHFYKTHEFLGYTHIQTNIHTYQQVRTCHAPSIQPV